MFLSLNVPGSGLAYPFLRPKLADTDLFVWWPYGAASSPVMFETIGLEVVFKQNVLAVGFDIGLCFDTCLAGFGGT